MAKKAVYNEESISQLKGADRVSQIEKVEDYVFMIKGN